MSNIPFQIIDNELKFFCISPDDKLAYLRNRKHFLCFYRNTSAGLGEREMLWEHKPQASVSTQLFRVLPNFYECFYNSIETRRKYFLFLLENSQRKITENEENLIVSFIIKT